MKRSGSYTWEGDSHKVSKIKHPSGQLGSKDETTNTNQNGTNFKTTNLPNTSLNSTRNDNVYNTAVRINLFNTIKYKKDE